MTVLEPILVWPYMIDGFTNHQVVKLTSRLLNEDYTTRQAETERIDLETIAQVTIPINSKGEDGRSIVKT